MKSKTTLAMEEALYKYSGADGVGIYGCFEVTLGNGYGKERVDFMTMNSKDEFYCYEIKSCEKDFESNARLSFVGDFNYLLIPNELKGKISENSKLKNLYLHGVGLLLYQGNGKIVLERKAKKQTLAMAKRIELMHDMIRSLSRLSRYCIYTMQ